MILYRYLLKEISLPFFLILLILTFILFVGKTPNMMDMVVNKGVKLSDIVQLMIFFMPTLLVYTIPISLLISILIGMGRLSVDNEMMVLKASGLSLYRLFIPVLTLAIAAFLAAAAMTLLLVPTGYTATKKLLFNITQRKASVGIQEKVFNNDFQGLLIYADKIPPNGDYLKGVLISDHRSDQEPAIIFARRAYLVSDPENYSLNLRLENGILTNMDMSRSSYKQMNFQNYDIRLDIGSNFADYQRKGREEMSLGELAAKLEKVDLKQQTRGTLITELYRRITSPLSCLVFALIGFPVGIRPQQSAKSSAFTIGLLVILSYYLLQLGSDALVEMGVLYPIIGASGTTLLFLIVGIWFIINSGREKALWSVPWIRLFCL